MSKVDYEILPPGVRPRLLTLAQAATYCSLKNASFSAQVKSGLLPQAVRNTKRWDLNALDAALDRASGLAAQSKKGLAYDDWTKERG